MTQAEKNLNIYHLENFYCSRMDYLIDLQEFDNAHAIFEEFVVDNDEPSEYFFLKYHEDIS